MSNFSLADSEIGSRIGRAETADYDKRTRNVRPREVREGSTNAPHLPPSLPLLPVAISESATNIVDILSALYVQDVDAEEESRSKDKEDFKQDCLTLVLGHLFDVVGMSERVSTELGESFIGVQNYKADYKAEEEVVCSVRSVNRLIDILRSGIEDILTTSIKDFAADGTKSKTKVARQTLWYAKYRATIPGLASILKDLSKTDATTIVSLLAQQWSTSLPAFHSTFTSLFNTDE